MDRIYAAGAAGSAPAAPASPSTGYPTAGNAGTGTMATKPGAYWYHMIMEELMSIISAAGITPASGNLSQLLQALRSSGVFGTPAQFDSSTKASTTEFVQRALGNSQGVILCNTGTTNLVAADAGKAVILSQSGAIAVLPLISSVPNGAVFSFGNGTGGGAGSVQRSGADTIYIGDSPLTSVAVNGGESLTVVKYGGGWFAIGGSVTLYKGSLSFPSSLAANGYQKLPSGLIIQWGISGSVAAGGVVNVTLPITFPNAVLSVTGTPVGASVNSNSGGVGIAASVSALSIYNWGASIAYTAGVRWIAIGN